MFQSIRVGSLSYILYRIIVKPIFTDNIVSATTFGTTLEKYSRNLVNSINYLQNIDLSYSQVPMIDNFIFQVVASFVGGVGLSAFFLIWYFRNKPIVKYLPAIEQEKVVVTKERVVEKQVVIEKEIDQQKEQITAKSLGDRFEEYVVKNIYKNYKKKWRLVEWRSDKYIKEIKYFPESSSRPDLEYRRSSTKEAEFGGLRKVAFECKWRSSWSKTKERKDKIQLVENTRKYKMAQYRKYSVNEEITTYFAIGIGWNDKTSQPENLYFVELSKIGEGYSNLSRFWLEKNTVKLSDILS